MSPQWLAVLVAGMLLTGTINTILNKAQDFACVDNCDDPDPTKRKYFEQPVWQTLNMFVGEALCLLVYYASLWYEDYRQKRVASTYHPIDTSPDNENPTNQLIQPYRVSASNDEEILSAPASAPASAAASKSPSYTVIPEPLTGWNQLLLWIPTLCDMTATTLMNVGLIYISASIYQMLRGSVVLFTGTLSVWFLGRKHPVYRWFALIMVFFGVGLVGLSGIIQGGPSGAADETTAMEGEVKDIKTNPVGIFLVLFAQVFTAAQFVIEEKIMSKFDVPALKVVGLEGVFGLLSVFLILPPLYFTVGISGEKGNFFDVPEGFRQMFGIPQVLICGIGIIFSIALFNFFGLSVTRSISATSRSTIDTCRTLFIWIVSLSLGWETFKPLQVVGFLVLLYGTFLFNDAIPPPPFQWCAKPVEEEEVVHYHPARSTDD